MIGKITSRGHLYGSSPRRAIRVSLVIGLFALGYAVITLAVGFIPTNMFLRRLMGASIMASIWRNSMIQLVERTAVAAIACSAALALSGRLRGRLTGSGMLRLGAAMSGALAGAADVGIHKLWVSRLIQAAHTAPWRGYALSAAMTFTVALLITVLLITRSTKVLVTEG